MTAVTPETTVNCLPDPPPTITRVLDGMARSPPITRFPPVILVSPFQLLPELVRTTVVNVPVVLNGAAAGGLDLVKPPVLEPVMMPEYVTVSPVGIGARAAGLSPPLNP